MNIELQAEKCVFASEWFPLFQSFVVHFDSFSLPLVGAAAAAIFMEMICAIKLNESIVDYANKNKKKSKTI